MARCLVIVNEVFPQSGFVGDELQRLGYSLDPVVRERHLRTVDPTGADLVLVLGSDWSVYADETRELVDAEVELVRRAHGQDVPVFGVCFGAQVLAAALGAAVRRAPSMELGWCAVEPLDQAVEAGPWLQWHQDTFELPAGAELLARSPVGPQAFRIGRSFAVQFHPEVDEAIVAEWVRLDEGRTLAAEGLDAGELLALTATEVRRAEGAARRLVRWFCREVDGSRGGL